MERLARGLRVCISDSSLPLMLGRTGVVVRPRRGDNGAWINFDEDLPEEHRQFPASDPHGRGNHAMFYPKQCEAART